MFGRLGKCNRQRRHQDISVRTYQETIILQDIGNFSTLIMISNVKTFTSQNTKTMQVFNRSHLNCERRSDRKGTEFIQPKITVRLLFVVISYTIMSDRNRGVFTLSLCTL